MPNTLSNHLFWDSNKSNFDQEKHKGFIVRRVLEYGLLEDWKWLVETYGLETIVEEARKLRDLEPRALNFIAKLTDTPLDQFRCYITRQSNPPHWNF